MTKGLKCFAVALMAPLFAEAAPVDALVATVGSDTILRSDVEEELLRRHASAEDFNAVREELIDRKLILRAATQEKMTIQEWVVESRIREIVDKVFEGDRNKLMETLSRQKISYPEWRQRMKDDMLVAAMRWNVVEKNAVARPADMVRLYREHPERFSTPTKVSVSVILLKPEDAVLKEEVAAELATNDFAVVAKRYSADSRADEGGAWVDINPAEIFKPEICSEISELRTGALSRWIEIGGWSFLLRKDAETLGEKLTFDQAYERIESEVKETEAKKLYEAWIKRLRAETFVKVY